MRAPRARGKAKVGKRRGKYHGKNRPDTQATAVRTVAYVLARKLGPKSGPMRRIDPPALVREPAPKGRKPGRS